MEPYWTDGKRTIYHGDCREVLPTLGKFDLLLTDPPYGIGELWDKKGGFGACGGRLWDGTAGWDNERPTDEFITSCLSFASVAILWGGNYFRLPPSRGYLIWDKMQTGFSLADSEYAWVSDPITPKTFRFARAQLATEGKIHPTQKPTPLMRWCISFAPDAKTILDPFMGSGTTLVAAKLEGLEAVGIELSEKYCEAAVKRLQQNTLEFVDG